MNSIFYASINEQITWFIHLYDKQDLLQQVHQFTKGASYGGDSKVPTEERVKSALVLLRSLPSTRYAVLEYFGSLYDDALYQFLSAADSKWKLYFTYADDL